MAELSRIQVRKNTIGDDWANVGYASGDLALPIAATALPLPSGAATSAKQDDIIIELQKKPNNFSANHIDDYTTTSVTYIGYEDKDGTWYIKKIDETGNFPVVTYASITNNPTLTSYALGWAARTTATFGTYSQAF